jgi:hypothetical protein
MLASASLLTMCCLSNQACVPAPLPPSRQQSFNTSNEVGPRNLKSLRKFENSGKRWAVFTTLQQAYVLWVIAAVEGEFLLSQMALLAQLSECPSKSSLLRRTWLVFKRHPQLGVCGLPTNSSTKYTISTFLGRLFGGHRLEAV